MTRKSGARKIGRRSILATFFLLLCSITAFGQSSRPLSYLALGDSYTIGESVGEERRWPVQLANFLNIKGKKVEQPRIIAETGWRTDQLYDAVVADSSVSPKKFDLVSLLIGVNDQYQQKDIKDFPTAFEKILDRAIDAGKRGRKSVFVLSIPDYGATPFGKKNADKIGVEIDAYNAICAKVCERRKVTFCDITAISRRASTEAELVAEDGLHPSGEMYRLWVAQMVESVKKSLPKR
jgi:acyl-CoA thioesterase-1